MSDLPISRAPWHRDGHQGRVLSASRADAEGGSNRAHTESSLTLVKQSPAAPLPQHLTIQRVAEILDVDPKTIRRRVSDGSLPAVRVGSRRPGTLRDTRPIRIPADALTALVELVTVGSTR